MPSNFLFWNAPSFSISVDLQKGVIFKPLPDARQSIKQLGICIIDFLFRPVRFACAWDATPPLAFSDLNFLLLSWTATVSRYVDPGFSATPVKSAVFAPVLPLYLVQRVVSAAISLPFNLFLQWNALFLDNLVMTHTTKGSHQRMSVRSELVMRSV